MKTKKKVNMQIYIFKELFDKITEQAIKENRSKSHFIANVIEKYLEDNVSTMLKR